MLRLLLTTLCLLYLQATFANEQILNFRCDSQVSISCLNASFGESNVTCPANNQGELDLVELASQNTLSQPAAYAQSTTYKQRQANEAKWITIKNKELELCLLKAGSDNGQVAVLQRQINQTPTSASSINSNHCSTSLESDVVINIDMSESSAIDNYISACGEKITELVNTNQPSEVAKTKQHLQTLKNDLLKAQDISMSLALSGAGKKEAAYNTKLTTQPQIEKINDILETKEQHFLIPSWRDLALSYQFYTGIEYGKVGELIDNSTVRVGMLTYFRPGKELERLRKWTEGDCTTEKSCGFLWSIWPHWYGNFVLTGAAESVASGTDVDADPDNNSDSVLNSTFDALEYEIGMFWPAYFGSRGSKADASYQEIAFGPIVNMGGRKVDDIDNFLDRHYAGLRVSFNEETYFDVLYGKSEPLKGKRVELRGQLPVSTFGNGRLFLGGAANFEVSRKAKDENNNLVHEADSFKIFITWQTTFDDLWKGTSSDSD